MPDASLYKQKPCRHGMMLYNPRDTYVGRSLDLYGEFSEGEAEFLMLFSGLETLRAMSGPTLAATRSSWPNGLVTPA